MLSQGLQAHPEGRSAHGSLDNLLPLASSIRPLLCKGRSQEMGSNGEWVKFPGPVSLGGSRVHTLAPFLPQGVGLAGIALG